jgi:NAD(P)-dependent dehydrogenase (short-subunit alcohol dehydrogenase family)
VPTAHVRAATDAGRRAAVGYGMKPRELPVQRLGRPEEIAEAMVFLASRRAGFITSTVLGFGGGSIRATA